MATYLGTHGSKIQNYTTDPDNPNTGEVWFNATDAVLKFEYQNTTDAWSTGGNLNTARRSMGRAGTSQTASLAVGGEEPRASDGVLTELYNGSSWTEVNDLNTARNSLAGDGTQTSALAFGGLPDPANSSLTEEWNDPGFITKTITTS